MDLLQASDLPPSDESPTLETHRTSASDPQDANLEEEASEVGKFAPFENETVGYESSDRYDPENEMASSDFSNLFHPENETVGSQSSNLFHPENETTGSQSSNLHYLEEEMTRSQPSNPHYPENQTAGSQPSNPHPENETMGSQHSNAIQRSSQLEEHDYIKLLDAESLPLNLASPAAIDVEDATDVDLPPTKQHTLQSDGSDPKMQDPPEMASQTSNRADTDSTSGPKSDPPLANKEVPDIIEDSEFVVTPEELSAIFDIPFDERSVEAIAGDAGGEQGVGAEIQSTASSTGLDEGLAGRDYVPSSSATEGPSDAAKQGPQASHSDGHGPDDSHGDTKLPRTCCECCAKIYELEP